MFDVPNHEVGIRCEQDSALVEAERTGFQTMPPRRIINSSRFRSHLVSPTRFSWVIAEQHEPFRIRDKVGPDQLVTQREFIDDTTD